MGDVSRARPGVDVEQLVDAPRPNATASRAVTSEAAVPTVRAKPRAQHLSPAAVQRLGRSAGNRAIAGMVAARARQSTTSAGPTTAAGPVAANGLGNGSLATGPAPASEALPIQRYAGLGKGGGSYAPPAPPVPPKPEADPKFKKVAQELKKAAKETKAHPPAKNEAKKAADAAVPPANDKEAQAKAGQADKMAGAKKGGFDKAAFVAAVKRAIGAAAPKNLDEADKFGDSGKAEGVKTQVMDKVTTGKAEASKDVDAKTKEPPDPSKAVDKPVTPLDQPAVAKPGDPAFAKGMPKKVPAEQTNFDGAKNEVDDQMKAADVSESDLEKSNEPKMMEAVKEKKEGEKVAAEKPGEVRKKEAEVLKAAETSAGQKGKADLAAMFGAKKDAFGKAGGTKSSQKSKDEQKRAEVSTQLNKIFDATKLDVEKILNDLDSKVDTAFTAGEQRVRAAFTSQHKREMQQFKDRRYAGAEGVLNWGYDLFNDLSEMPEVKDIYVRAVAKYEQGMEGVINDVADIVGREIDAAKARIAKGRAEIAQWISKQPKDIQKLAADAAKDMDDRFKQLESDVDDKSNSLAEDLADKYKSALEEVNKEVEEAQAANRSAWSKAKAAIGDSLEAILKLKDLFMGILAKAAAAFKKILADPLAFIGNFMSAVKAGFLGFADRIAGHLKKGLQGWLFGKLGEAGIQIPDKLDLPGILQMVLSLLGLTWANIRGRIVKRIGEKAMTVLEGASEVFMVLVKDGVAGLWKWIVDKVGDLKEMVIGQIRDFVIEKIVKAGITWVIGMLNPAGALIKIVQTLISVIQWIMEKGGALVELVGTVVDSVSDIANGGGGGVPAKIEGALARAVPIVISFLASLLGLGGISDKIKSILEAVQKPVMKAVDAVIDGALKLAAPLIRGAKSLGKKAKAKYEAGKAAVMAKAGKAKDWVKKKFGPKKKAFTMNGSPHHVIAQGDKPIVEMASVRARLSQKIGSSMGSLKKRQKALGAETSPTPSEAAELRQLPNRIKDLQSLHQQASTIERFQDQLQNTGESDAARGPIEGKLDDALNTFCRLAAVYGDRYRVSDIVPLNNVSDAEEAAVKARAGTTEERDFTRYPGQGLANKGGGSMAAHPEAERVASELEKQIGARAISHPKTNQASDALARAAKSYLEQKAGETWRTRAGKIDALLKKTASPSPKWSGSVGDAIDDLRAVFDGGNINERITHIEAFNRYILTPDLATANQAEFDTNLAKMEAAGMDRRAIEARREGAKKAEAPNGVYHEGQYHAGFAAPSSPVIPEGQDLRQQPQSRMGVPMTPSERRAGDVGTVLSDREKELYKKHGWREGDPVPTEEGMRIWVMNERNKWVHAHRQLSIPLGAGPSGSTNIYMQVGRMLGVTDAVGMRLACIAALVPTRHHTLVEVLTGAAAQGMPFTSGPRMYRDIRPFGEAEVRDMAPGRKFPDEVVDELKAPAPTAAGRR